MAETKGKKKYQARKRRQRRVRAKVYGTAERPRLNIFRSNENIFAQIIEIGRTEGTNAMSHDQIQKTMGM